MSIMEQMAQDQIKGGLYKKKQLEHQLDKNRNEIGKWLNESVAPIAIIKIKKLLENGK